MPPTLPNRSTVATAALELFQVALTLPRSLESACQPRRRFCSVVFAYSLPSAGTISSLASAGHVTFTGTTTVTIWLLAPGPATVISKLPAARAVRVPSPTVMLRPPPWIRSPGLAMTAPAASYAVTLNDAALPACVVICAGSTVIRATGFCPCADWAIAPTTAAAATNRVTNRIPCATII